MDWLNKKVIIPSGYYEGFIGTVQEREAIDGYLLIKTECDNLCFGKETELKLVDSTNVETYKCNDCGKKWVIAFATFETPDCPNCGEFLSVEETTNINSQF